jgi:hypothetical protein
MHLTFSLGESPGVLFVEVVRGPVIMSERPPPLTNLFTQSFRHGGIIAISHS